MRTQPTNTSSAQSVIIRRARDFTTSCNIQIGVLPYGNNVIHAAPPYQGDGYFQEMYATYEFAFTNGPAQYKLEIEYAALESRPCGLYWDDILLTTGDIGSTTGGWEEEFQRWEYQGIVSTDTGIHTLKIRRAKEPIPHIRTIRLTLETGG